MSVERIVLGGGCFWCIEAVFVGVAGVQSVTSGYAGGHENPPTYERVCSGVTGHAEVVEVVFETEVISLQDLLRIFFTIHDPTTLNRQGNDIGSQYRSAIFYASPEQLAVAQRVIADLTEEGVYHSAIVTTLEPLSTFYAAEDYHQDYFAKNPGNPYCQYNILPKRKKLTDKFSALLKPESI